VGQAGDLSQSERSRRAGLSQKARDRFRDDAVLLRPRAPLDQRSPWNLAMVVLLKTRFYPRIWTVSQMLIKSVGGEYATGYPTHRAEIVDLHLAI
jgi:hypothetical protein